MRECAVPFSLPSRHGRPRGSKRSGDLVQISPTLRTLFPPPPPPCNFVKRGRLCVGMGAEREALPAEGQASYTLGRRA